MFHAFMSGGVFVSAIAAALFFLRFWKDSGDRFFLFFSFAFALIGIERLPLVFLYDPRDTRGFVYLLRLSAFLIILFAIWVKNNGRTKKG